MKWSCKIYASFIIVLVFCLLIYLYFIVPMIPESSGKGAIVILGYFVILILLGYVCEYVYGKDERNE